MDRLYPHRRRLAIALAIGCVCVTPIVLLYCVWPSLNLWQYGFHAGTHSENIHIAKSDGRLLAVLSIPDLECGPPCNGCDCWVEKVMIREKIGRIFCITLEVGRFKTVSISSSGGGTKSSDGSSCSVYCYYLKDDVHPTEVYLDGKAYRLVELTARHR